MKRSVSEIVGQIILGLFLLLGLALWIGYFWTMRHTTLPIPCDHDLTKEECNQQARSFEQGY